MSNNKIISEKEVLQILNKYLSDCSINIFDVNLYRMAFANECFYTELLSGNITVDGYTKDELKKIYTEDNENLELAGDSIISSIIKNYLKKRFNYNSEGFISITHSKLTKTNGLSFFASKLKMEEFLLFSSEMEEKVLKTAINTTEYNCRNYPMYLENCFEAFVGALYDDHERVKGVGCAYEICHKFIISLLEATIDFSDIILQKGDCKIILQTYFHKNNWEIPEYSDVNMEVDDKNRHIFTRGVYIPMSILTDNQISMLCQKYQQHKIHEKKILIASFKSYKKGNADLNVAKLAINLFKPELLYNNILII